MNKNLEHRTRPLKKVMEEIGMENQKIKKYKDKSLEFLLWFNNNAYKNKLDTQFLIELGDFVTDLRDIDRDE